MTHRRQDQVGGTAADGQPAQVQGEVASDSHRTTLGQGDLQKPALARRPLGGRLAAEGAEPQDSAGDLQEPGLHYRPLVDRLVAEVAEPRDSASKAS